MSRRAKHKSKSPAPTRSVLGNDPFARQPAPAPVVTAAPTPMPPVIAAPVEPEQVRKPRPGTKPPPITVPAVAAPSPAPAPPVVPQAMVKAVLIPEIDTDPPPTASPPPSSSTGSSGSGPLARLRVAAEAGGKHWLMKLAESPQAMRSISVALSGAQAVRALVSLRTPPPNVDEFGQDESARERYGPSLDFLYDHYWRVEVKGAEHLPASGPMLSVCNHGGALPLDGPVVRAALERSSSGRRVRWLVEDAVFHAPFLGTWLNRMGAVRACPENAERLLEEGQALVVFPEGIWGIQKGWRRRYQLQRFGRGGFVKLALRSRSALVPTAVIGAEEAMPILATAPASPLGIPFIPITPTFPLFGLAGLMPLPAKWTVVFGAPIDLSKYGPDDANDQALVQRITEDVRDRIHEQSSSVLSTRRSIFRS